MPRIWVWTAPDTPIVQRSPVPVLICGDIAEGGGLRTVVSIVPDEETLLSLYTVSAACAVPPNNNNNITIKRAITSSSYLFERRYVLGLRCSVLQRCPLGFQYELRPLRHVAPSSEAQQASDLDPLQSCVAGLAA